MSHRNAPFPCPIPRSPLWRPCCPACARSPPGRVGGFPLAGVSGSIYPFEVRGNFERLMLSGSRALEFLGNQGVTVLGNLMLSHQDSLLLDARSTVPAEEVACLHYADLRSSPGIFPSSLLDSDQDARGFERRSCSADIASSKDSSEIFGWAVQGGIIVGLLC